MSKKIWIFGILVAITIMVICVFSAKKNCNCD